MMPMHGKTIGKAGKAFQQTLLSSFPVLSRLAGEIVCEMKRVRVGFQLAVSSFCIVSRSLRPAREHGELRGRIACRDRKWIRFAVECGSISRPAS